MSDKIGFLIQIIIFLYISIFTCVSKYYQFNGIDFMSPTVFFLNQIPICILQTFLLYSNLNCIFPQVIYKDDDYKKIKRTLTQKIIKYFFFSCMILDILLILFTTSVYIINFLNDTSFFYLQLIQFEMGYFVIFYFFNSAFSDFSGQAYCEYYQSQNSERVKFSLIPMTLTWEMRQIYNDEFYIPNT